MITAMVLLALTMTLAWANGANDVSKGVAALAGSGVATPRAAWLLGVAGTTAGGLAAVAWGGTLGSLFGGGFLHGAPSLPLASALAALIGAGGFVLLATWLRWPVSTTHALIGGIVGAAWMNFGAEAIALGAVLQKFLVPLLFSPVAALGLCWLLLRLNRVVEARVPRWRPGCCDPEEWRRDPFVCCPSDARPPWWERRVWLALHWLSGGAVSFARGLNDVPKMAALALPAIAALPQLEAMQGAAAAIVLVSVAMALGSLMAGRRLLPVLAEGVSTMTPSTGLFANLGAAVLVLGATPFGLPVSTTHVAAGSLIGVRVAERAPPRARDALRSILCAWLVTLPSAAVIAAAAALVARS
ncbi:MAG: inorganic phosphate transporter [Methylocystis sp.]|nr:inorganic phosphate transporter [Methylocystis sp.]